MFISQSFFRSLSLVLGLSTYSLTASTLGPSILSNMVEIPLPPGMSLSQFQDLQAHLSKYQPLLKDLS